MRVLLLLLCGSWLASDGGLQADQSPTEVTQFPCGSEPAREGALTASRSPTEYPNPLWELACQRWRPVSQAFSNRTERPKAAIFWT